MKCRILGVVLFAALAVAPAWGQDGTDVNKAIPIYFNQVVDDIVDANTGPVQQVYKIAFARGQKVNILMTAPAARPFQLSLWSPTTLTTGRADGLIATQGTNTGGSSSAALTISYDVATAGAYYVRVYTFGPASRFQLQVKAEGTPIVAPNPTSAGCLNGRVDSITYSLQLIAAGLPDEIVIGGARACAACQVKAPLYPEIVNRIENAMRSRLNVEACYDGAGSIFQIKLVQP